MTKSTVLPVEQYREMVSSLINLPTLPIIATEILRIVREDKASINQILPVLEKDPPLAMKVLKFANSSYYGLREKVKSLRHAIVVIGMKQLSQLAMAFSVMKILNPAEGDEQIHWKRFWEHSSACGHITQLLDEALGIAITSSPYSLGLLHDIGKLVLFRIDPRNYSEAFRLARQNAVPAYSAEEEIFGFTHESVGLWIAEKWQLPTGLIQGIGFHHHPENVEETEFRISTALVQIANLVANFRSISFSTEFVRSVPREESGWKILAENYKQVENLDFEYFVMSIEDQLDTIREMVQLVKT